MEKSGRKQFVEFELHPRSAGMGEGLCVIFFSRLKQAVCISSTLKYSGPGDKEFIYHCIQRNKAKSIEAVQRQINWKMKQ